MGAAAVLEDMVEGQVSQIILSGQWNRTRTQCDGGGKWEARVVAAGPKTFLI